MSHHFFPLVSVNIDHGSKKLNLQISVLTTVLGHDDVLIEIAFKSFQSRWRELSDVAADFEKQGIIEFDCSLNKLIKLLILSKALCITPVCREIYSESYKFLSYNGLWAVNDQLVHNRNAFSVSKCGFCLVFKAQMVQ